MKKKETSAAKHVIYWNTIKLVLYWNTAKCLQHQWLIQSSTSSYLINVNILFALQIKDACTQAHTIAPCNLCHVMFYPKISVHRCSEEHTDY